jgi:hypothetical protein
VFPAFVLSRSRSPAPAGTVGKGFSVEKTGPERPDPVGVGGFSLSIDAEIDPCWAPILPCPYSWGVSAPVGEAFSKD